MQKETTQQQMKNKLKWTVCKIISMCLFFAVKAINAHFQSSEHGTHKALTHRHNRTLYNTTFDTQSYNIAFITQFNYVDMGWLNMDSIDGSFH